MTAITLKYKSVRGMAVVGGRKAYVIIGLTKNKRFLVYHKTDAKVKDARVAQFKEVQDKKPPVVATARFALASLSSARGILARLLKKAGPLLRGDIPLENAPADVRALFYPESVEDPITTLYIVNVPLLAPKENSLRRALRYVDTQYLLSQEQLRLLTACTDYVEDVVRTRIGDEREAGIPVTAEPKEGAHSEETSQPVTGEPLVLVPRSYLEAVQKADRKIQKAVKKCSTSLGKLNDVVHKAQPDLPSKKRYWKPMELLSNSILSVTSLSSRVLSFPELRHDEQDDGHVVDGHTVNVKGQLFYSQEFLEAALERMHEHGILTNGECIEYARTLLSIRPTVD